MRALRYSIEEALASLRRGGWSSLLSIATIVTAMFVLGGVLAVTSSADRLLARWSAAAEFSVYLRDEISPAEWAAIDRRLAESQIVSAREYVSKAEAQRRFQRQFALVTGATEGLSDAVFPASFEVRLRPADAVGPATDALVEQVAQSSGVADVRYDKWWLDRLSATVAWARRGGVLLASILAFAAALTVASVVRLALNARRGEIEIMRLVGAPRLYIGGPFVVEGVLQGGIGAAIALAGLWLSFLGVQMRPLEVWLAVPDLRHLAFLSREQCAVLLGGGMLVGCLGGMVAATGAHTAGEAPR